MPSAENPQHFDPLLSNEGKDLLITDNVTNASHGAGILLCNILDPQTCINIRRDDVFLNYGEGPFPYYRIDLTENSRSVICSWLLKIFNEQNIRRIIYISTCCGNGNDLFSIVAKSIFDVPLLVWVMDDNLRVEHQIAKELFTIADIVFVISPEMRDFYEGKFQRKFYILPPTVKSSLIASYAESDISRNLANKTCVLIGNIWHADWLVKLCRTISKSDWTIHWYSPPVKLSEVLFHTMTDHGIVVKGYLPQKELAECVATYPFAIISVGSGNQDNSGRGVTYFSLSSRVPFLMATTHTPLLVMGSKRGCVANFVRNFGIGVSVDYDQEEFLAATAKLTEKSFYTQCVTNAATHAKSFSDEGLAAWMWKSCEKREPIDDRFEKLFQRKPGKIIPYQDDPIPSDLAEWLQMVYRSLKRLAKLGYRPDFIIDVGAALGEWSAMAQRIFPCARFILIEPLLQNYSPGHFQQYPQFEWICAAAANENGNMTFQVSHDLFGSSLLYPKDERTYQSIEVPAVTLDTIMGVKAIYGRGILKIDVQHAEHLVLSGAIHLLEKVDIVILELTLRSNPEGSKNFLEMIHLMESLGFQYFDDAGVWRCPIVGTLREKDVLFMRSTMLEHLGN